MTAIAKPKHEMIGRLYRITFGKHLNCIGTVLDVFPRDAVRTQETAMLKLTSGRIVTGVPVKDLAVLV